MGTQLNHIPVNHHRSYDGEDDRDDVSSTLLQPVVAYTTPSAYTLILQYEGIYNWETEKWTSPIMGMVSKMMRIGNQNVSFAFGARHYLESPDSGPEGFAFRFNVTFLFPG